MLALELNILIILNILISCNCSPKRIRIKDLPRHEQNKDTNTFFMHFVLIWPCLFHRAGGSLNGCLHSILKIDPFSQTALMLKA